MQLTLLQSFITQKWFCLFVCTYTREHTSWTGLFFPEPPCGLFSFQRREYSRCCSGAAGLDAVSRILAVEIFRLRTASPVGVVLPSSPPESEFFRARIDTEFHSIVLPSFFSQAVYLWRCMTLTSGFKAHWEVWKRILLLRTCPTVASGTAVTAASSAWPQPLCRCTQPFQDADAFFL